ncbi:MAG: DUF2971 domain-containing protein [Candidatus Nitrohelix vancouverensis]|uniref:DUF2971 domain-containing protein n=1 Tax=Candidatus Nitrohelix vancouverensis TaxID=2705534 RepID=A0A7T0C057_9BACT|nr:MAG: DUF2971 domain-containing protein [Candidatus Nitrohelix vancouverensis]
MTEFSDSHPFADQCGVKSLFRFYRIGREDYLRHLFIDKKLYHSLPSQFNDPFECKPHFIWPENEEKVRKIRQHLENFFIGNGESEANAKKLAASNMKNLESFQNQIQKTALITYGAVRICSFTTRKENLLFWSHYADSHRGFCVEFDATKMPIKLAYKVQYKNEYPEFIFPAPRDENLFIPALVKSKDWEYEEEFRIIFVPESRRLPPNDGESLILESSVIKNIYFGSNMDEGKKGLIIKLIKEGKLNPGIWNSRLSKSTFSLEFEPIPQK